MNSQRPAHPSGERSAGITPGWLYLTLAVGATWLFWIPAALLPRAEPDPLILALHYLGGVMPLAVALILLVRRESREARLDYWRRLVDLRRIRPAWGVVTVLAVPGLTLAAVALDRALGGQGAYPEQIAAYTGRPMALLSFAVFIFVFGPLPEELGWRGFGLDPLQARYNALTSSLVLGAVWTAWHLPLFWIEGSWQHSLGVGTPAFWLFLLDKIPQSLIITWIFNNTGRSTLTAILLHFSVNFVGELYKLTRRAETVYVALWWVIATTVTLVWKPARLTGASTMREQGGRTTVS